PNTGSRCRVKFLCASAGISFGKCCFFATADRDQMSGIRCQETVNSKPWALRTVEGGKTPRPNFSAPAEAGGNFLCSLSPVPCLLTSDI
ncbi:MAG: hypothetical protein LBI62_00680, partial [Candidatus Accumulibacter sp.]|nr:hypothetical protein [Accumulibacter sp.]